MKSLWAFVSFSLVAGAPEKDLVDQLPGFPKTSFKVYSGLLDVPGPLNGYDSLKIHYQFHSSQNDPSKDPVVVWHQGGPGGSSIMGAFLEMGFFQVAANGTYTNSWAWNRVANMLYLESPAGSGGKEGYSQCIKAGKVVNCQWDDSTQAEAYAHTLQAFFHSFPELSSNQLYMAGESYFGQYGPNIARFILNTAPFNTSLNLKGMAVGNGCWGEQCNGPNRAKNNVDLLFGKGLFSPKLYKTIMSACHFPPTGKPSKECMVAMAEMTKQVGPYNVYNIYDNCPLTAEFLAQTGKDMHWLAEMLRAGLDDPVGTHEKLLQLGGGYPYACHSIDGIGAWLVRTDVRKALHLDSFEPGASSFGYKAFDPLSVTLYPEIIKKIRVLIYNGDADACVPYIGNEEWISDLESTGALTESQPWRPWFTRDTRTPAGYLTKYSVPGSSQTFEFQTIRLAGHMVPEYQPEAAFTMISRFLSGGTEVSTSSQKTNKIVV